MLRRPLAPSHRSSKGFTLIELMIVIAIIAVMAVLVFIVAPKVKAAAAARAVQTQVNTISTGVESLYASTNNYTGLTTTIAISAQIPPSQMVTDPTDLHSSWNGAVTIVTATAVPASAPTGAVVGNYFDITYANVPVSLCAKLAASIGVSAADVQVGGTTVMDAPGTGNNTSTEYQVDPATSATQCQTGGSAGTDMTFVFGGGQ